MRAGCEFSVISAITHSDISFRKGSMQIAIIGWGSLIWDPRELPTQGVWHEGGPGLPIQFSRVSKDRRLTLVIDHEHGSVLKTRYILSARNKLDDAIEDLRIREGTTRKNIAFVDLTENRDSGNLKSNSRHACEIVRAWLVNTRFQAAIWTGLPPNFKQHTGKSFTIENALAYLDSLPDREKQNAVRYIRKAPREAGLLLQGAIKAKHWTNLVVHLRARLSSIIRQVAASVSLLVSSAHRPLLRLTKSLLNQVVIGHEKLRYYRTVWAFGTDSRLITYAVMGVILFLIVSVLVEIALFYVSHPSSTAADSGHRLLRHLSFRNLILGAAGIITMWFMLGFLAKHTLITLTSSRRWYVTILEYLIRLAASIPTLILGNELIKLSNKLDIRPQSALPNALFVTTTLILIGLPTVLNIGQTIIKDHDNRSFNQALSLGVSRILIGKRVMFPSVHSSFHMAITLAVGRILIEAYIVIHSMINRSEMAAVIKDSQDFISIFYAVYSSMTVEANATLLIVLFVFAMLGNLWAHGFGAMQQK